MIKLYTLNYVELHGYILTISLTKKTNRIINLVNPERQRPNISSLTTMNSYRGDMRSVWTLIKLCVNWAMKNNTGAACHGRHFNNVR